MIITHASQEKIVKVLTPKENSWYGLDIYRGCLFFGSEDNDYNLAGHVEYKYNLEVDEDKLLEVGTIAFDYSHEDKIVAALLDDMRFDLDLSDISDETLLEILDDREDINDYFDVDADVVESMRKSWLVQQYQGILAHKLGYDAAQDVDEQGALYIVYCVGRELKEKKITN